MWVTLRLTKMLYFRTRDTLEGKDDKLMKMYTEHQYDDLHKDSEDMMTVNFRYGDHRDRSPMLSYWSHMIYKPDADKTKQAHKFYKFGTDSYIQWFFNSFK